MRAYCARQAPRARRRLQRLQGQSCLCACEQVLLPQADSPARVGLLVPSLVEELGRLQGDQKGVCLAEAEGGPSAGRGRSVEQEVPCAWPPATPSPASCCPRRPRRLSASAASAPPPPGSCTAGSCLWPSRCLLEWEQGKDAPSSLEHQGASRPKAAARAPLPGPGAGLSGGLCQGSGCLVADPELTGWAGARVKHSRPMAETLRQATPACRAGLTPTPPLGARVRAEEPRHRRTRAPGRLSLGDRLTPVPAAQNPARSATPPRLSQAAVPAVSAGLPRPGLSEGAPPSPPPPLWGSPLPSAHHLLLEGGFPDSWDC